MFDIRFMDADEIGRLHPLAEAFYGEGHLPGELDFDVFQSWWEKWITEGTGIVLAAEREGNILGVIGGLFSPSTSTGDMILSEMFWFASPDARGSGAGSALLDRFVVAGKDAGADGVSMVRLTNELGEKLDGVLKKYGFRPLEVHYYLEI